MVADRRYSIKRAALLVSGGLAALLLSSAPVYAVCTPNAADNVTATCTGTTTNQNTLDGFGTLATNNLGVTVVQGATVTGTVNGIALNTGSLANSGTITGINGYGVAVTTSANVGNSGLITGFSAGVRSDGDVAVTNSGSILTPNGDGIYSGNNSVVINSGLISALFSGVNAQGAATVTNSGTVLGTDSYGVHAGGDIVVTNSGTIRGATGILSENGSANVTNSGTITTTGGAGILAWTGITLVNSGSITTSSDGVYSFANATITNSGVITAAGGRGVSADVNLTLNNSGSIFSLNGDAVVGTNSAVVSNSGLINGFFDGVASFSGSATVTNSGTILGLHSIGVYALGNVAVSNSGLINGFSDGVASFSGSATVTNSGTILGMNSNGVYALNDVVVTNSGSITGANFGVIADNGNATVTNTGIITATSGVGVIGTIANVTNSGTIVGAGASGIGIVSGANGNVVNSGTIIGGSGTAIRFGSLSPLASDSLTVLPGARFGGLVDFGGGADKVVFGPGSWILNTANFDKTLSSVTTAGNPYVVTPNQIIVADLSSFGAQNRAIMDITGWISSVLPDAPVFAPGAEGGVNAFAAADTATSPFAAFDSFPSDALGYAKAPVFKAANVTYADGNAVWAKAFGGQRLQDSGGGFVGGTTTGYGGAVGYERLFGPDLKIGALIGGSTNKTNLYLNAGSTNTDTVFAGAYGRKTWGATFLDLSVIGGNLDNTNLRNVGGGLAVTTANASYGSWFVNPALMFGHRLDIDGRGFTVTPTVKVRYVAAHFDGYAETGAGVADLTVAGRDFQAWEERAELTFANTTTLSNGNRVTARVTGGILGQQRSAGGQFNVVLVGQSFLAATPDRSSVAGGYGSAGLDWQMGRVTLFSLGEATYTNDVARTYAGKGGVRVSW